MISEYRGRMKDIIPYIPPGMRCLQIVLAQLFHKPLIAGEKALCSTGQSLVL